MFDAAAVILLWDHAAACLDGSGRGLGGLVGLFPHQSTVVMTCLVEEVALDFSDPTTAGGQTAVTAAGNRADAQ